MGSHILSLKCRLCKPFFYIFHFTFYFVNCTFYILHFVRWMGCHILRLNCRLWKPYLGFFHTSIRTTCQANLDQEPFEKTYKICFLIIAKPCGKVWVNLCNIFTWADLVSLTIEQLWKAMVMILMLKADAECWYWMLILNADTECWCWWPMADTLLTKICFSSCLSSPWTSMDEIFKI